MTALRRLRHTAHLARNRRFLNVTIESSFYQAARKAGTTYAEINAMTEILGLSIDFRKDIRRGDRIEALIEEGPDAKQAIRYVSLVSDRRNHTFYRVEFVDGHHGYFDADGRSLDDFLDPRPLSGARISSRYGPRIHPIRKAYHVHRGTDFAAPSGTPIPAAGPGVVVEKGWRGGHGRYVRIRHNGRYMTAYAHMKGYAKGIEIGSRVTRGQIIGYVGSSGLSTGPHLHFEVLVDGVHVDPQKLSPIAGASITGDRKTQFAEVVARIDHAVESHRLAATGETADGRTAIQDALRPPLRTAASR